MDEDPPPPTFIPRLGDDSPADRPQRKWEELFYPSRAPERPEIYERLLAEFDRLKAYMAKMPPEDYRYDDALRQRERARVKIMALVDVAKASRGNGLSPEDAAQAEASEEERYQREKRALDAEQEARVAAAKERARKRRETEELSQAGREGSEAAETAEDRAADRIGAMLREEMEKRGDKVVRLRPVEKEEGKPKAEEQAPVLVSALDLYHTPFPPIDWVIEGFLAAGTLTILAGKPKIGKSFLALQAALSIARGDKFLELPVPVPGPVWFLGLEDTPRRLNARITGQLGASVEPPASLGVSVWWPRSPDGLEWIKRIMGDIGRPRLIVVDTYARFRALAGLGSRGNMYDTQYDDLVPMIDFCAMSGVAILLIHHTNKAGATDVFDRISGSVALQGAVDTMMVLDRERASGASRAQLSVEARDFEGFSSELEFEKVPGTWKLIGPASVVRATEDQEALLAIIRGLGGEAAIKDIAAETDPKKTQATTRKALNRMKDAKLVELVGMGVRAVWRII